MSQNLCETCEMNLGCGRCAVPDHPGSRRLRLGEAVTVCPFFQTQKGRRSLQEDSRGRR